MPNNAPLAPKSLISVTPPVQPSWQRKIAMSPQTKSVRLLRRNTSPAPQRSVIFNHDRFTLWLSHPELPISLERFGSIVRRQFHAQQMPYNPLWKARLEVFQPTRRCLRLLVKALGNEISTLPTYAELACDLPANSEERAQRWRDEFFATAQVRYQRHPSSATERFGVRRSSLRTEWTAPQRQSYGGV